MLVNLEFEVDSERDVENSLHKVETLAAALAEFRSGILEEARLYRERNTAVERLNRQDEPRRRPRRQRHPSGGRRLFPGDRPLPKALVRKLIAARRSEQRS